MTPNLVCICALCFLCALLRQLKILCYFIYTGVYYRRTFSSSCPENGTTNTYPLSTPDEAFSSDKLAEQDGDDSDYEVFRVKRRSTIVLEKRCSEDVTTNLTENQVTISIYFFTKFLTLTATFSI